MTRFWITILFFSFLASPSCGQNFIDFEYFIFRSDMEPLTFAIDSDGNFHYRLYNDEDYFLVLLATNVGQTPSAAFQIYAPSTQAGPTTNSLQIGSPQNPIFIEGSTILYPEGWTGNGTTIAANSADDLLFNGQSMIVFIAEIANPTGTLIDNAILGTDNHEVLGFVPGSNTPVLLPNQLLGDHDVIISDSWQNTALPFDTNGDGCVAPLDALFVINQLTAADDPFGRAPAQQPVPNMLLDVNKDGFIAPLDANLAIQNFGLGCD